MTRGRRCCRSQRGSRGVSGESAGGWTVAAAALALPAAIAATNRALDARAERRVPLRPSLARFDLATISVATGCLLLPDFLIGPGPDPADRAGNLQYADARGPPSRHARRVHGAVLAAAAFIAPPGLAGPIVAHPRAWLAHRWRLARALFDTRRRDGPQELGYVDDEVRCADNPPVARNRWALHRADARRRSRASTVPLAAWPYLLAGLVAWPFASRRRGSAAATTALVLPAGAWLYALPPVVLAPSAELRHLGGPCVASLLALACAMFMPAQRAR